MNRIPKVAEQHARAKITGIHMLMPTKLHKLDNALQKRVDAVLADDHETTAQDMKSLQKIDDAIDKISIRIEMDSE